MGEDLSRINDIVDMPRLDPEVCSQKDLAQVVCVVRYHSFLACHERFENGQE